MLFKTDQREYLQETGLPVGWLRAVSPPNSHNKEKHFTVGTRCGKNDPTGREFCPANKLKVYGCFEATLEKGKDEVYETVYVVEGLQTPLAE